MSDGTLRELFATYRDDGRLWLVFEDKALALAEIADSPGWTCRRMREVEPWDGRSVGESAPHAAYCDIALADAMTQIDDKGELVWSYNDALFDASLAGNGWKVVPVSEQAAAVEVEEQGRRPKAVVRP